MISRAKTFRTAAICLLALGAAAGQGCLASQADIDQAELDEQAAVASTEQALLSGGWNQQRLGYTCTGTSCECSKAIENDCENMTAVCTDKTVDAVITCINGWLTTHCSCTKDTGLVRPTTQPTLQLNSATTFNTATLR
jgi:hypothetical protein